MPSPSEARKLYRVTLDISEYFVTADDPFGALARVVAHEDKEGNNAHLGEYSAAHADSVEIGTATADILAWEVER